MYFINVDKCNVCGQKKSVVTNKKTGQKACFDCNPENYKFVSAKQKEYWISGKKNKSSKR